MSYKHLNTFQRGQIEALYKLGLSCRKISDQVGCDHSTVSREVKRNEENGVYNASKAHDDYRRRISCNKTKTKLNAEIRNAIELHLQKSWSPEQITGRLFKGQLSFKTIYRWIKLGEIKGIEHLRQRGKRQKTEESRGKIKDIISISERPQNVNTRDDFGHWELDTMVSSRGKSKSCLATFLERKTRMYIVVPMKDRSSGSMLAAIKQVVKAYPLGTFKSFTSDRGKEFSCHKEVKGQLGIVMYFADAYSSWQRGSNENANGLLREFIPKKTDLGTVTREYLFSSLKKILNRPRKILNWRSVYEVFHEQLLHLA